MEYYNDILCFEVCWLIDNDILTKTYYDKLIRQQKLQVVRRGCKGTPALVTYDSMPVKMKDAIQAVIGGDPYKKAEDNAFTVFIQPNNETFQYFENYKLSDGRFLPKGTRKEYYANAIILDAVGRMIETLHSQKQSRIGRRCKINWEVIARYVQEVDPKKYPHTLPAYPSRLNDRYKRYKKEGIESLIHKNFMNKNAGIVAGDEVKESVLMELLASPHNLDNAQVMRQYNQLAENMGWSKISRQTVAVYRDRFDLEIYAGRRGGSAFANKKKMQIKRSAPTAPLYYWTMDGWTAEFLYQKRNNKNVTTYHNRLVVYVILDPFNKYPIGYAIGEQECGAMVKEALRNAVKHTEALFGEMHRPWQIQSDNGFIQKVQPICEALADKYTPARARNAKAKVIEPYFMYLNKKYGQEGGCVNWAGFGIVAEKEHQRNIEQLNNYKKLIPDKAGAIKQIEAMIALERNKKMAEYVAAWQQMADADKLPFSMEGYLLLFGEKTGRTNLLQGSGLNITIEGQLRNYECFDIEFRRHASTSWHVLYDPADKRHALAVNGDESLRFLLEEKHIQPMALKDRKDGDAEALKRIQEFNKQLDQYLIAKRKKAGDTIRDYSIEEQLDAMRWQANTLITDSEGQHKKYKKEVEQKVVASLFEKY